MQYFPNLGDYYYYYYIENYYYYYKENQYKYSQIFRIVDTEVICISSSTKRPVSLEFY